MTARKIEEQIAELDRAVVAFGTRLREEVMSEAMRKLEDLHRRVAAAEAQAVQVRRQMQQSATVVATPASVSPPQLTPPQNAVTSRSAPPPRAARSTTTIPELPLHLTIRTLDRYLQNLGFAVKNNRSSGSSGAYWVLDDGKKFGPIMEALKARGVLCELKARRKMYSGPSIWVDTTEVLPE